MLCTIEHEHSAIVTAPCTEGEEFCPVDWAKRSIAVFRTELCGRSLFCREGMAELYKLIEDISEGKGKPEDLTLMVELCDGVGQMADCETAKTLSGNLAETLARNADVWDAHIRRKRCAALTCGKLLTFYIDAGKCTGCGECRKACPVDAIEGDEGLYHVLSLDDCTKCGQCAAACKSGAVAKATAGAVLPKRPDTPGAVGSFKSSSGGLKRGLRGRT